jgi:hypothetical protein
MEYVIILLATALIVLTAVRIMKADLEDPLDWLNDEEDDWDEPF